MIKRNIFSFDDVPCNTNKISFDVFDNIIFYLQIRNNAYDIPYKSTRHLYYFYQEFYLDYISSNYSYNPILPKGQGV